MFVDVLRFLVRRWVDHRPMLAAVIGGMVLATLTDVLTPVLAGRLMDDVAHLPDRHCLSAGGNDWATRLDLATPPDTGPVVGMADKIVCNSAACIVTGRDRTARCCAARTTGSHAPAMRTSARRR